MGEARISPPVVQALREQIAPHLMETNYDHLPKKQGPLTGSQSLPTSLAQTMATLCRPVGCSWDPCEEMGSAQVYLVQLLSDLFDTLGPIQDLLCCHTGTVCTGFTF